MKISDQDLGIITNLACITNYNKNAKDSVGFGSESKPKSKFRKSSFDSVDSSEEEDEKLAPKRRNNIARAILQLTSDVQYKINSTKRAAA